ncbi:MAG TPA: ribonuclease R [Perlabentimonas sp.]|nr:ribonuclease R [Perlabentimonas sp.]
MVKKKKNKKTTRFNKNMLMKSVMSVFSSDPSQSLNYKELANIIGAKDATSKRLINEVLYELVDQKMLQEVLRGKFMITKLSVAAEGVVEMERDGNAYVITNDNEEVFVPEYNLNHALHGDWVKVATIPKRRRKRTEAEVVEIVERAKRTFVGKIEVEKNYAFVIADNRLMPHDIFIPKNAQKNAKNGQKVIVRITDWPMNTKNPMGEVVEVIGNPGEHEVEMHAILAEFELPYRFPKELDKFALSISEKITKADYEQRRDFRNITTFTIDPADAKDFDDALSFREIDGNTIELGVHIADVTHYVKQGGPIDNEAIERATSVYLVDRCVPMLPERLSNFICSLRPNEEKLCFSAVFEMDLNGNIKKEWFGRTVIKSQHRFAYEDAQQVIETGKGTLAKEILALNSIAQKLRYKRLKAGAINFDRAEARFDLDEKGKPLGISFRVQKEANHLIEEFMLLANRSVAIRIGKSKEKAKAKPFVYRIHDKPNSEKFETFRTFITRFGYNIEGGTSKQISKSLNKLLTEVKGKKEQNLIETLAVRSMAKARYTTENIGHYGLGFPFYTHFTSPIRRYPDMMVHRLLAHYLKNGKPKNEAELEHLCKHSTDMEIKATDAERASIKYKQVEFMSDKIGQHFQGVITGVTSFGLFVETIETKCEGLVAIRDLDDDFYEFDEDNYCLIGRQNNKKYQLGDELLVEVYRTNLPKKQLDYRLAENLETLKAKSSSPNKKNSKKR